MNERIQESSQMQNTYFKSIFLLFSSNDQLENKVEFLKISFSNKREKKKQKNIKILSKNPLQKCSGSVGRK